MKRQNAIRWFKQEVFWAGFVGYMGPAVVACATIIGCGSTPPGGGQSQTAVSVDAKASEAADTAARRQGDAGASQQTDTGAPQQVDAGGTPQCVDACESGARQCSSTGDVVMCTWSGDCRVWSTAIPCPSGKQCKSGKCVSSCTPTCNGKVCGDDGCGGLCGSCPGDKPLCTEGQCQAACTDADEFCDGDTLHRCDAASGLLKTKACSKAFCVSVGYVDYAKCGGNPGDQGKYCLCKACSVKDNGCDGGKARTCDESSGKMTVQTCPADKICFNGACVKPCQNECSAASCQGGKEVGCQQGADGCMKKLGPATCKTGELCLPNMKGCGPCKLHSDCPKEEVCAKDGLCKSPFGLNLAVTVKDAIFPSSKPTGGAWDIFGGLPDPQICVASTYGSSCTSVIQNSLNPVFDETLTVTVASGDNFCVQAWDSDTNSDDEADGACWKNLSAVIKAGGFSGPLYNNVVTIDFTVDTTK